MRPTDKIKNSFRKLKVPTSPRLDGKIHEEISRVTGQTNENKPVHPVLWRIIMKSKITKFGGVAMIIGLIVIGVTFMDKTSTPAYAIGQTIEAMRKITTVHCYINLFQGQRMEVWSRINPQTGENEYFHMSMPGMIMVSTPEETYRYNQAQNVVIHLKGDGHVVSDIRFGRFIEDMTEIAHSNNGKIEFEESFLEGKPVILVVMENDQAALESIVDPVTKLPISMTFKPKGELQSGQLGQSIEDFTFNEPLPEGIFDFVIPQGAKVIEQ